MNTLTASKNRCRICVLHTHISGTGFLKQSAVRVQIAAAYTAPMCSQHH